MLEAEVLTARRRLLSKVSFTRVVWVLATEGRSASALRFNGFFVSAGFGLITPFGLESAGFFTFEEAPAVCFALDTCVMRGEDDELEGFVWLVLEERLWVWTSDALVGGDDPKGEGFRGGLELADGGRFVPRPLLADWARPGL